MFSSEYSSLTGHDGQIIATYVWIDDADIYFKYRTLNTMPEKCEDIPLWTHCNDEISEIILRPCAQYKDPFHDSAAGNSVLVLCEPYTANDVPTNYNKRSECREIFYREEIFLREPWFGIEFSIETKNEFPHQSFVDAFYCVCLHAGVKICSASSTKNRCKFQIGPCDGISVGDDLWIARFLLQRLAEKLEINVTPKIDCGLYVSTKEMREADGLMKIERTIDKLCADPSPLLPLDKQHNADGMGFTSFRIPLSTKLDGKGYFQCRRPSVDCDAYELIGKIIRRITFNER